MSHWPCSYTKPQIWRSRSDIVGVLSLPRLPSLRVGTHVMTTGRQAEVGSGTAVVVTYVHERVRRRRRRRRRRRNVAGRRLVAAAAPVRHGRRRFSGPLWRCFRVVGGRVIIFSIRINSSRFSLSAR